jgi:hypothetical protein
MQRRLLVYDADGKFILRAADFGERDGMLQSPVRLVADHDTVLVLDVTHQNAVSAFSRDGRFIGARFPELHEASVFSLALGRSLAAFGQLNATDRPGRSVVAIRDRRGRELGSGCAAAEALVSSELRHGKLADFSSNSVTLLGNRIYCAQAVSPIVTVLDFSGTTVGYVTVAPPFYVPPLDIPGTQNQKTIMDFESKWTAMRDFSPSTAGFMSLYARYDVVAGRHAFQVFACDSVVRPTNCRSGPITGEAVRILAPDKVLSVVSGRDGSLSLQVLQIDR